MLTVSTNTLFDSGLVKAILLDHAGVLVKIEDAHGEARANTFNHFGCSFTPLQGKALMGYGEKKLFTYMQDCLQAPTTSGLQDWLLQSFHNVVQGCGKDYTVFQKLHQEAYTNVRSNITDPLQLVRPGMAEMLLSAHERSIPVGIISNSDRADIIEDSLLVIERINQLCFAQGKTQIEHADLFKVIIAAEDVQKRNLAAKPSPTPYLQGMIDMMRLQPAISNIGTGNFYIVEDSEPGFNSADRSGALVTHVHYHDVQSEAACTPQKTAFAWVRDDARLDRITLNPSHPVANAFISASLGNEVTESANKANLQALNHPSLK